jgi:hypothetical protein
MWVNPIVISGRWGSSFVFVKLITESMHPFAFAASRGLIAMSPLLVWLALRSQAPPLYNRMLRSLPRKADSQDAVEGVYYNGSPHCAQRTLVAVAQTPRAGGRP